MENKRNIPQVGLVIFAQIIGEFSVITPNFFLLLAYITNKFCYLQNINFG